MSTVQLGARKKGFLSAVERAGNAFPDPVFIFVYLILGLIAISVVAASLSYFAVHPITGEKVAATSLLSATNLERLVVDMPTTFTHFHPLGYVLTIMLGAGVAERAGFLGLAMRAAVKGAPTFLLTPAIAFVGMMGNLAADAAHVILIPLAGVLFAAAGRHPLAGIAAGFASVSGGFSANLLPGQLDALLFGITQTAAATMDPGWQANIAGNWYFIAVMLLVFLPIIWLVTDHVIEPRLGPWTEGTVASNTSVGGEKALSLTERKGLRCAGIAVLVVVMLWVALLFAPGTPLIDESAATPEAQLTPFYRSVVAGFFFLFLAAGWAYGVVAETVKSHRDVVQMMAASMADLGYYLVLAFAAAHFVAMFQWSNLGLIFAIDGANLLKALKLPVPALVASVVVLAATMNLFIGSASAKWALLAPVLVPMFMLLNLSPETATAVYRVGDSVTNIVTPLFVYFPLVLTFCRRWNKEFGLGSLLATMIPYSFWLMIAGLALTVTWVAFGWALGPGATIEYSANM